MTANSTTSHSNSETTPNLRLCKGGLRHALFGDYPAHWTIFLPSVVTWVPVLILTLASRNQSTINEFQKDWPTHMRFLAALPIFLLAERPINHQTGLVAKFIIDTKIVETGVREKLIKAIERINRIELRGWTDGALLLFLIAASFIDPRAQDRYTAPEGKLALAWLDHISMPIFQVFMFRWLQRLWLWTTFLFRCSHLKLKILPHHPDGVGGLGFLRLSQQSFGFVVVSISSVLAAVLYREITVTQVPVESTYKFIAVYYLAVVVIFLGPLLFFSPQLWLNKNRSVFSFSRFSDYCSQEFVDHWIAKNEDELSRTPPLDTGEISSMTDLITTHEHTQNMATVLIDIRSLIAFAVFSLAPIAPVFLALLGARTVIELILKILT